MSRWLRGTITTQIGLAGYFLPFQVVCLPRATEYDVALGWRANRHRFLVNLNFLFVLLLP